MFVPHIPIGHIWLVSGYKGQELKKQEYKGKRTERAVGTALQSKRHENRDIPVFLYYEDDRTPCFPVTVPELLSMKVITNKYGSLWKQKVPKRQINGDEFFEASISKGEIKSGFDSDKLPTKAELRKASG